MAVWSIVNLSRAQKVQRFDSDYWQPEFLENEARLNRQDCATIRDTTTFVRCGPFGSNLLCENYIPDGVLVIRPFNLKNFTVERDNLAFVSEKVCMASHLGYYEEGDILFARVGDVRAGVLRPFPSKITISPNIIAARLKPNGLNPYYVTSFMNSRFGMAQLLRSLKTVAQPTITVELVKEVRIPLLSRNFQTIIAELVRSAIAKDDEARTLHERAESDLNSALGLDQVDLAPRLFYEDRFSRVAAAGRFDAEHFQPKFAALLDTLRNTGIKLLRLGEIIKPVKNGFDYRDFCDEGTPYIRVGDVKQGRLEIEGCARIPLKAKDLPKDVTLAIGDILFTRKGSFGNAAHVRPGFEHAIISSEIMLIRLKPAFLESILPEYLALYFNSKPGALQAEKWAHGVAFYSISQEDLARFVIPILPMPMQQDLKTKTDEAESARQESRRLLDTAKRAVEIAIEDGEEAARKSLAHLGPE